MNAYLDRNGSAQTKAYPIGYSKFKKQNQVLKFRLAAMQKTVSIVAYMYQSVAMKVKPRGRYIYTVQYLYVLLQLK